MNIIKEHIILLMGVGFFVVGLFDFRHSTYSGGYYYDELALFLLFVGSRNLI